MLSRALCLAFGAIAVAGCGDAADEAPAMIAGPLADAVAPPGFPAGPIAARAPADNALTEVRAQLGKRLFFDKRLSRTGEIACESCHHPALAFADDRSVSPGVEGRLGKRNAPSLANLAWNQSFFWDGRAPTLERQTGMPIEDPVEMDLPISEAVARVGGDAAYLRQFNEAYGGVPSPTTLRAALASFVRSLVSGNSAYDRHLRGDERDYGDPARRGERLFFSDLAGCFHCHPPGALTNDGFFNNGSFDEGGDPGRAMITGRTGDVGKFKVPGLRNVAVTAPYMHDGSVPTLAAVIEQYGRGGRGHPSTDPQIAPLSLSAVDQADLLAFLHALTDETFLSDQRFRR